MVVTAFVGGDTLFAQYMRWYGSFNVTICAAL